jgi:hypothetical protein
MDTNQHQPDEETEPRLTGDLLVGAESINTKPLSV